MSDQVCRSKAACTALRQLLLDFSIPEDDIADDCMEDNTWPCQNLIENSRLLFDSISPENAKPSLELIAQLFSSPSSIIGDNFRPYTNEPPFQCPELSVEIYQPCGITSCSFFTDNNWTKNCILYYRLRHSRDVLNLNELSFLLKQDVGSLRSALNRALRGLSNGALKELIDYENPESMFTRIPSDRVCVVCEKRIPKKGRAITKMDFTYCSKDCYRSKPPNVLRIEQEFNLPTEEVLKLCVSKFSNIRNMCNAIGVGQNVLFSLCDRYGIEIPDRPTNKAR